MDNYVVLKFIHILCAMVVVGTGAGIAFFQLMAFRSKNISAIMITTRHVVLADWIFTTPAIIGQFITGVLLMRRLSYSFDAPWFLSVISLFIFIGCCWIPVVFIQYKLKAMAKSAQQTGNLDQQFFRWMKIWTLLGIPAFIAIIGIIWLMVAKPLAII